MLPSESFIHRFPTPLAAAWRNTELTRAPSERRAHVIAAADVAVRLLVAVLKADCDRDERSTNEVSGVFEKLVQASWGRWGDAVTAFAKALRVRGDAVTSSLVDVWLSRGGGAGPAQIAFRDLIPLRNESAHKGPALSTDVERAKEAALRGAAVAFLEALEPLAELMLFQAGTTSSRRDGSVEGPWFIFRGTDETVVPRVVTWTGHIDQRRLHVWLPQAGQALLVEPYLRVRPVASLNMDGLHLFAGLDRQGALVLRHDRSGDEQAVARPTVGDAHASPLTITSGLARESGTLPVVGGRLIGQRYELRRRIQRGSVCDVFEAFDTKLGRTVAVKLLRDDVEPSRDLVPRFERESEVLARLEHPNIVRVLDHVHDDAGRSALVLEMVAGGSLREQVGQADPRDVRAWMRDALTGLAYAHEAGVVHRDLRPDNVLVGADGVARLADFDLAALSDSVGSASLTRTRFGIIGYLAPELLTGAAASPASDIYALGTTWDELLHGELRSRTELGVGLEDEVRSFIVEMTASSPSSRPSAAELLTRLAPRRRSRGNTTVTGLAPPAKAQSRRWFPWFVGAVMVAFLAVVGWAIAGRYFGEAAVAVRPSGVKAEATDATPVAQPPRESTEVATVVATSSAPAAMKASTLSSAPASSPKLALAPSVATRLPAPVTPTLELTAPAQGLGANSPTVIPAPDEPAALVPQPVPLPSTVPTNTLGWWYFDTLVMGSTGVGNEGVIGHFSMAVRAGVDAGSIDLTHVEATLEPKTNPEFQKPLGYEGTASWKRGANDNFSTCVQMRLGKAERDQRWFHFRFEGNSLRGWWISQSAHDGTERWGALRGARSNPHGPPSPDYIAAVLSKDVNDCARGCFEGHGGFPCSSLSGELSECVGRCAHAD